MAQPPSPAVFDAYALPRERRPQGPAALAALLVHLAIAVAVLWRGALLFQPGAGGPGKPGGGGGGRPAVTWFALPAPSAAPQPHPMPPAPVVVPPPTVTVSPPDPVRIETPALVPSPPTVVTTGATGEGPGTDGGRGTGTGGGVGSATGPDSGGEGGYIFPAYPRGVILPPDCVRGEVQLRFWVEVDGHVSRVEVSPTLRDARCRRETFEQLRAYQFKPATTRDGRPVASVFQITYTH